MRCGRPGGILYVFKCARVRTDIDFAGSHRGLGAKQSGTVLLSFETMQTRTHYLGSGVRLNTHYDLAIAYLF